MLISVEKTIQILQEGSLVALKSDTLYGLSCKIHAHNSLEKIFSIKKRNPNKSLIILFESVAKLLSFIKTPTKQQIMVMKKHWPGPITLIFEKKEDIRLSDKVLSIDNTIAARVPLSEHLKEILRETGPIVSSSINLSGKKNLITHEEIHTFLGINFPVCSSNNSQVSGQSSTIYCFKRGVLREGSIATPLLPSV